MMTTLERIKDCYGDETFLAADGFDKAIVGVDENGWSQEDTPRMRLVYSTKKCIELLVAEGMNEEEANEYFEFNVRGACVGVQTPIFMEDRFKSTGEAMTPRRLLNHIKFFCTNPFVWLLVFWAVVWWLFV